LQASAIEVADVLRGDVAITCSAVQFLYSREHCGVRQSAAVFAPVLWPVADDNFALLLCAFTGSYGFCLFRFVEKDVEVF
jgi:hypothetical protein